MKKYVVAVTGASGIIYAQRLLEVLSKQAEVYVIITKIAKKIAEYEMVNLDGFDAVYVDEDDMFAGVASGSFRYDGMVVIPCSMKTLSAINSGFSDNLITRAADVCLKEGRKCILMPREMPLSRIHLKNMLSLNEAGATIMVMSPGFYNRPETIADLVDMVVARALDNLGEEHDIGKRWSCD
ncbi:UbiX family flavin prenyltransferase [Methanomicrobium antiquum]|uniref:Flavin prenyltransferase UbiX n=1 Tax=Methanomicrobium antiquum TaxID=487686 RepID=A0AAF0FSX3_9EURY|nr:UbiX family flavin prenyltransferase [Methanomicrobium antiquum]MDD3977479.1 UbiX family flavin prenyltransferase [Methanomicrobium sp.]WFN37531.1 UbiX family flavin prenyltransferase [Methanomicrobium antiquum]